MENYITKLTVLFVTSTANERGFLPDWNVFVSDFDILKQSTATNSKQIDKTNKPRDALPHTTPPSVNNSTSTMRIGLEKKKAPTTFLRYSPIVIIARPTVV